MHPFVLGELACRNLRARKSSLALLANLPGSAEASNSEVMQIIESCELMGRGIGFIDAHLLAATMLSERAVLWTRDRRLAEIATGLGIGFAMSTSTSD